jgi:hypothetical protein
MEARIMRLSQDFYSLIPHRLGTTKEEVHKAIINNLQFLEEKQDLLQLMKDIIEVQHCPLCRTARSSSHARCVPIRQTT